MNPKNLLCFLILISGIQIHAENIRGRVMEQSTEEAVSSAGITNRNTGVKTVSDSAGFFSIEANAGDILFIEARDFVAQEYKIPSPVPGFLNIALESKGQEVGTAVITHNRLKEKLRESPVTVESLGISGIKETPAADFYEALGHLKGVDLTTASMGFKVINTRGFNSTSPVRSLQLIDGVDNQAPGLNFSLGNFLGASELDIYSTEIVVGASSAYYGPNAFNGVIKMTTKSPWEYRGLSAQVKMGERDLGQLMLRYAKVYKNSKGRENLAFKVNLFYMRAYDWPANNQAPASNSADGVNNPGGYNAVNRYGDEEGDFANNTFSQKYYHPGLGNIYRDGYWEKDVVSYKVRNLKSNAMLAYKINSKNEIQIQSNFGTGTTVYQGDNRYSLNDVLFFQHRIEWIGKQGFLRLYATHENAGNTYDAVLTALMLQNAAKPTIDPVLGGIWTSDYTYYWDDKIAGKVKALPGYPNWVPKTPQDRAKWEAEYNTCISTNIESIQKWQAETRNVANSAGPYPKNFPRALKTYSRFEPGTYRFDSMKNEIINRRSFDEDGKVAGSKFFDKSALIHLVGERRYHFKSWKFTSGFNQRLYLPNSQGTLFLDTGGKKIRNFEYGVYSGVEKRLLKNRIKMDLTLRLDKNINFNYLLSPAASFIYSKTKLHTYRISFSSALRNPTLQDQYLHYNVGPAILLGNVSGLKHVYELDNWINAIQNQNWKLLDTLNIARIRPERVQTIEVNYKGVFGSGRLTLDAGIYYSIYKYFIGYKLVVDGALDKTTSLPLSGSQLYRVATNSKDLVSTEGASFGFNYFFWKFMLFTGNWSFNILDRRGSTDPLIPAFNTPKNKFNIGLGASSINKKIIVAQKALDMRNWGFNINYKWVQGFRFEGSPQFTGNVNTYWLLDAQISKNIPKWKSVLKVGGTNLTNHLVYQVYGGPAIGRMMYISLTYEP